MVVPRGEGGNGLRAHGTLAPRIPRGARMSINVRTTVTTRSERLEATVGELQAGEASREKHPSRGRSQLC